MQPPSFNAAAQKLRVAPVVITSSKIMSFSGKAVFKSSDFEKDFCLFKKIFPFRLLARFSLERLFWEAPSIRFKHRKIGRL